MNVRHFLVVLIGSLLFGPIAGAADRLSAEQIYSLFNQANEAFRRANSITEDSDQAARLYETAILCYEKIVNDGGIKNSKLYYNLGNAYFLKEDVGRAILNYRRAERLDKSDANIQKNLSFARSRRIDKVTLKTEKRVLQTLFFWHYDFSIKTKFVVSCVFFAILCISLTVILWFGRSAPATSTAVICGILLGCFIVSVFLEAGRQKNMVCGVITAEEVVARQGDGQNYPASFKASLHAGTEFDLLEHRLGWFHIRLSDGSEGWIPEIGAELI
jgi:tetratricopeptide (TPR) repeat protein